MPATETGGPANGRPLPLILVVAEYEEMVSEVGLTLSLQEFGRERFRWLCWSVMDTLMRMLPPGLGLAVMDIGLFTPLYRELLEKLLGEGGVPVLIHLTDARSEVVRFLAAQPRVSCLRKPVSLHEVVKTIENLLGSGRTPA